MLLIVAIAALDIVAGVTAQTQGQKSRMPMAKAFKEASATQQPLYGDYKGVRIGMTAEEARAKLGQPALKADDQDYYVFSEKETAQIAYDATHKMTGISVDYVDGAGAPDPKTVVGGDLEATGLLGFVQPHCRSHSDRHDHHTEDHILVGGCAQCELARCKVTQAIGGISARGRYL